MVNVVLVGGVTADESVSAPKARSFLHRDTTPHQFVLPELLTPRRGAVAPTSSLRLSYDSRLMFGGIVLDYGPANVCRNSAPPLALVSHHGRPAASARPRAVGSRGQSIDATSIAMSKGCAPEPSSWSLARGWCSGGISAGRRHSTGSRCWTTAREGGCVRITRVETFNVFAPGANPPFIWRDGLRGSPPDREVGVIRLRTDQGVDGVAIAPRRGSAPVVTDVVEHVLRDELIGADPLQREWLWHRMWEIDRTEELPIGSLALLTPPCGISRDASTARRRGSCWEAFDARSPRTRRRRRSHASPSTWTSRLSAGSSAIQRSNSMRGVTRAETRNCARLFGTHVGDDYPLMYDGSADSTFLTPFT